MELRRSLARTVWSDLDPALINLILYSRHKRGLPQRSVLHALGLSALQMVGTMITVLPGFTNPGRMTSARRDLISASAVLCYANRLHLCRGFHDEDCVYVFITLLGALYWHLAYRKQMGTSALAYIHSWLLSLMQPPC